MNKGKLPKKSQIMSQANLYEKAYEYHKFYTNDLFGHCGGHFDLLISGVIVQR